MGKRTAELPSAATSEAVDAVVFIDERNVITFCNAAAAKLCGLPLDKVIGRDARRLLPAVAHEHNRRLGVEAVVGPDRQVVIEQRDGAANFDLLSVSRAQINGGECYLAFVRTMPGAQRRSEQMHILSLVADRTDRGVVIADMARRIRYVNRAFLEMLGFDEQDILGRDLFHILATTPAAAGVAERIEQSLARRSDFAGDVSLSSKKGKEVWVSATITPVIDAKTGDLEHVVAMLADITHMRMVEDMQRQVLSALAADVSLPEIMDLLCRKVEGLAPGVHCSVLRVTDEETLEVLACPSLPQEFSSAINGIPVGPKHGSCGTAAFRGEPVLVDDIATSPLWEDFRWLPVPQGVKGCWSVPIKLRSGKVAGTFAFYFPDRSGPTPWLEGVVAACSDLCALALERSEARSHIARLASIDTLTGLPNRTQLIEAMSQSIAVARKLDQPLAVLFLDIDHFKDVNDTLGHSTGDQILVEMARRLKVQLRTGDTVGRTGGDEFVVLIHDCAAEEAARICRRLVEYLATPVPAQNLHLTMSVSIGVALCAEHGTDAETLLKHADTAMHEAKRKGPGKFQFFTDELNRRVQDRLVLSVALREAIQNRQLRLAYQPQVLLGSGALHGVEALARWTDPVHGEVPAPRFIALAEEYGLIDSIDQWGVEEACHQIVRWRAEGVHVPHVSVNLSPLSFRSGEIVGIISAALERHGLVPQDLRVEITERVMMDQHPNSLATARAIEALGVRIAMDDFGTGYSSLSALSRLPIAELKLDRSFMLSIEQDPNAQALSTAVIRIGHSLGMTVVAEGVETAEQAALLRALGCHAAQGYYFARPLAPEDLRGWMAAPPAVVPAAPDRLR